MSNIQELSELFDNASSDRERYNISEEILNYLENYGGCINNVNYGDWLGVAYSNAPDERSAYEIALRITNYLEQNGGWIKCGSTTCYYNDWLGILIENAESVGVDRLPIIKRICGYLAQNGGYVNGQDLDWWKNV